MSSPRQKRAAEEEAETSDDLLTDLEKGTLGNLGHVAEALGYIVGPGPTRTADLAELIGHVHVLQRAILAQAAARARPDLYRFLGGLTDPEPPEDEP